MEEKYLPWSLDALFSGDNDPLLQKKKEELEALLQTMDDILALPEGEEKLASCIRFLTELDRIISPVAHYYGLRTSADTDDKAAASGMANLMRAMTPVSRIQVALIEGMKNTDPEVLLRKEEFSSLRFFLEETKELSRHTLTSDLEEMIGRMNLSGGSAWGRLFSELTANLSEELDGKTYTLTALRNMAHDPDASVRKAAYEAELRSYRKVERSLAYALNSIKAQVKMLAEKRGYGTALDEALFKSRLGRESFDAMISAIRDALPMFRRYLKAKARALGEAGEGLSWENLFAPVGENHKVYSYDEAKTLLLRVFGEFAPSIRDLMKRAFDENWIDVYPRDGKVGGAFCMNLPYIRQSRVLANYGGTLDDISTLAHELGHAYHGSRIEEHHPLNQEYTMPVAETASTFNETVLAMDSLKRAESDSEKLSILEGLLMNVTQTVVDILSRFLFESEVFERCDKEFLTPEDLKEIMNRAQKEAYGDGLKEETLHPYMWACKGHYYSAGLSFYNYPYAFGHLFALGLYTLSQEEPEGFMDRYDAMLTETTVTDCEGAGRCMGVDLTKKDFWKKSLSSILPFVEEYERIVEGR